MRVNVNAKQTRRTKHTWSNSSINSCSKIGRWSQISHLYLVFNVFVWKQPLLCIQKGRAICWAHRKAKILDQSLIRRNRYVQWKNRQTFSAIFKVVCKQSWKNNNKFPIFHVFFYFAQSIKMPSNPNVLIQYIIKSLLLNKWSLRGVVLASPH